MSETLYSGHVLCAKCGKAHWMYGQCGDVATITNDSTEQAKPMSETPTPHNPANLSHGIYGHVFGWRLLDADEIIDGPLLFEIEVWIPSIRKWRWHESGSNPKWTYRTKLSREELLELRLPTLRIQQLERELAEAREKLAEWDDACKHVESDHPDEQHCGCVPVLRKLLKDEREKLHKAIAAFERLEKGEG